MRDPIVETVRAIRDEIAREHNYDLKSIFRMLRRSESSGVPHVKLSRSERTKLLPHRRVGKALLSGRKK